MALNRRKIKALSQEKIGWELGLVVSPSNRKYFKKVRVKNRGPYGTDVYRHGMNKFFKKYSYQLKMRYFPPEKLKNPDVFIKENLKKGNDVIACFRNDILFASKPYGHVSIISGISKNKITIADPNLPSARFKKVNIKTLMRAIRVWRNQYKTYMGGFWIISSIK